MDRSGILRLRISALWLGGSLIFASLLALVSGWERWDWAIHDMLFLGKRQQGMSVPTDTIDFWKALYPETFLMFFSLVMVIMVFTRHRFSNDQSPLTYLDRVFGLLLLTSLGVQAALLYETYELVEGSLFQFFAGSAHLWSWIRFIFYFGCGLLAVGLFFGRHTKVIWPLAGFILLVSIQFLWPIEPNAPEYFEEVQRMTLAMEEPSILDEPFVTVEKHVYLFPNLSDYLLYICAFLYAFLFRPWLSRMGSTSLTPSP